MKIKAALIFTLFFLFIRGALLSEIIPPPKTQPLGPPLFLVTVNGNKGFISKNGEIAIAPIYQNAYPFSDGLAAVKIEDRWGYINTKGHLVIRPKFVNVGFFSDGLSRFQARDLHGPWGYINKSGEIIIEAKFDYAEEFRKGIARVGSTTTKSKLLSLIADVGEQYRYRFINSSGKTIDPPPQTHYVKGEPNELIQFTQKGKVGYLNKKGAVSIAARFKSGTSFSEGLACVCQDRLFGFIDKNGSWIIPPRFQYPNNFSQGLAGLPLQNNQWGFIDPDGKTVIEPRYQWIYGGFRHGLAEVLVGGKIGYINQRGEWIWKPSA